MSTARMQDSTEGSKGDKTLSSPWIREQRREGELVKIRGLHLKGSVRIIAAFLKQSFSTGCWPKLLLSY